MLSHADIIYTYFKVEKMAREYGFRLTCNWKEGVFRLYHSSELLECTDDIMVMSDLILLQVDNQKRLLGLE